MNSDIIIETNNDEQEEVCNNTIEENSDDEITNKFSNIKLIKAQPNTQKKVIDQLEKKVTTITVNSIAFLKLLVYFSMIHYLTILQEILMSIRKCNVKPSITSREIKEYIFIYIYSSVIVLPEIRKLWSKTEYYSTIIPKVMNINRFNSISKYLHISDYWRKNPIYLFK